MPAAELLHAAVEANVRSMVRQAIETPEAHARMKEGVFQLVGAVYDINTGAVRFLD